MKINEIVEEKFRRQAFLRNNRLDELAEIVNKTAKKIDSKFPEILVSMDHKIFSYPIVTKINEYRCRLWIPYLFLIKQEDLPEKFLIQDPQDPRLQNEEFLKEFYVWSKKFLSCRNDEIGIKEKNVLKIFLKFISNGNMAEKAKDFVINHEIAHIFHDHKHDGESIVIIKNSFSERKALVLTICLAGMLFAFQRFTKFWPLIPVLYFAIGLSRLIQNVALSKKNEQEADLTSASWSPDSAHGGAYLFHLIKEQQKESRKHSLAARLLFSSEGHNRLLYFSHPTETQRICYLATPLGKSAASPSSTHLSSGLVTQLASQ